MSRYIDADLLMEQMKNACMGVMSGCEPFNEPLKVLESAPTADVVEVVRCKDCKHRIIEPNDDWCECTGCDINPDGFCEEGERKEDD